MAAQQLLLSWKDHNGAIVEVFRNLLKKNTLVDCTLAAEGQYLKAHKVVLSACSSYFELLFSQESEKNPIVILKDIQYQELEAAVNFMYTGEVEVSEDRLAAFLEVAESLQIKGLGSGGKFQDSKEKVSPIKHSSPKFSLTERKQSRKEDQNPQSDNSGQSSSVPANSEQIRNYDSSSVHRSSRRGNSPTLAVSTSRVESSYTVRKETCRDSDNLENIQQSLVLPSFNSDESGQSEENPIIKSEPETDAFSEKQSDKGERDIWDEVTMMDDQDDCDELNSETMHAVQSNQQDIGYPSENIYREENASKNVEGVEKSGNRFSSEDAGWILPNNQQEFSSIFEKEEPCRSASWNQINTLGVSTSSVVARPSSETSAASAGVDSTHVDDHEQPTQAFVEFSHSVAGGSGSHVSWKPTDASFQQPAFQLPSEELFTAGCKITGVESHMTTQSYGSLPRVSMNGLTPNYPTLPLSQHLQRTNWSSPQCNFFKCSDCDYMTSQRYRFKVHVRIHTGEKPYKCAHCDLACRRKDILIEHMRIHTGEKPYKCLICNYACTRSNNLVQHIRTHLVKKTFKCPHCDYASMRKGSLNLHLRAHTKQRPSALIA